MAAASIRPAGRGHEPGSRVRAWAVAGLLAACIVLVPAYVVLVVPNGSGAADADIAAAGTSDANGATDRAARVTFHLRDGALGLRLLRDAPPAAMAVRGRRLDVTCGYAGRSGLALVRRPLRWRAGSPTARVALDRQVLASAEFCSLSRGGRGVARVVFP